jgi:hypothetical protein
MKTFGRVHRALSLMCIISSPLVVGILHAGVHNTIQGCQHLHGNHAIAQVEEFMPRNGNNIGPGSLIADAMLAQTRGWSTQVALLDVFSIRSDLTPGPLTSCEARRLILNTPLIVFSVSTEELTAIIEKMAVRGRTFSKGPACLHVSGIRFSLDMDAADGEKVTALETGTLDNGYSPAAQGATVRVVAAAPLIEALSVLGAAELIRRRAPTHVMLLDAFTYYVSRQSEPLVNCTENRINTVRASLAVISDPHYFLPSLLINNGPAFQAYLAQDRKLLAESNALLLAAVSTIRASRPEICLIPGDLTKDGELLSHESVARILADSLLSAGVNVFVAPGNHDINNPEAFAYDGATTIPVDAVTPDQFEAMYEDCGYGAAIARDPASLTYIAEPENGLWILSIDACKYMNNLQHPITGGAITQETLAWILEKLDYARARNIMVIGMMHHGLTEHFTGQTQIMMGMFKDYVIDNWQWMRDTLAAHGLKTIFTGHYHAQDIVKRQTAGGDFVYDIETGSTISWPCPIRSVALSPARTISITTQLIDSIDYPTMGLPIQSYARQDLEQGLTGLITYILTTQFGVPAAQAQMLAPAIAKAFCAHYAGDETPGPMEIGLYTQLKMSPDPLTASMGSAIESLWTDLAPADNCLSVDLVSGAVR